MQADNLLEEPAYEKFRANGYLTFPASAVLRDRLAGVFLAAEHFFSMDLGRKLLDRLPRDVGYRPYGVEYSQSAGRPDQIESFSLFPMIEDAATSLKSDYALHLYNEMSALLKLLEPIAEQFLMEIAELLSGRPIGETLRGAFHLWSHLQINHAHTTNTASDFPIESHEDGSVVTIMTNTAPGLELQGPDGSFSPISTNFDELVLISGEILWLLSGGTVGPTYHRVRTFSTPVPRMALLYFVDLEPSLCEPWIRSEANRDVDIGERVRNNATRFGLLAR
jgi:isopenicillin N synthase-like dioxygenase